MRSKSLIRAALTLFAAVLATLSLVSPAAVAQTPGAGEATLLLPLRSIGVSDTTARVAGALLAGELRSRGWTVLAPPASTARNTDPSLACDEPACALEALRARPADRVVYGSMSQLGRKVVMRLSVLPAGATTPSFNDQLAATSEEDLDTVIRRFAAEIVAGRADASRASVETVLEEEAREKRLRSSRSGVGFRAGFLFPTGKSYAGSDRLTHLQIVFKHEQPGFLLETTPLLGFTFGDGHIEWTALDVAVARIFGQGDMSPFLGVGVGVHSTRLEKTKWVTYDQTPYPYSYEETESESATAPVVDLVGGILGFRTFDFEMVLEARYRYLFHDFDKLGGKGAHGVLITFGSGT